MTGKSLFSKTMPFCFAKFVLGGILVLVSALLFAIMMGIGWLFSDGGIFVALLLWLSAIKGVHWVITLLLDTLFAYTDYDTFLYNLFTC